MANPHTAGTERFKLYQLALNKGNTDKAAALFTETNVGKGLHDLSGGVAVAATNLPKSSGAVTRG